MFAVRTSFLPFRVLPAFALTVLCANAAAGPHFRITSVTDSDANDFYENSAINDSGQLAGTLSYGATRQTYAFLYSNGRLSLVSGIHGGGSAINNRGVIAGSAPGGLGVIFAFAWNTMTGTSLNLGTLGSKLNGSQAFAINNSGQIAGSSQLPNGGHAFLYSNGAMSDLGTLGGLRSAADGMNDSGQIVGESEIARAGVHHAFLYSKGTMFDLGTLGGANSAALAINNQGQIVGVSDLMTGGRHAFLRSKGAMIDIGTLGGMTSWASAINGGGQIVGWSNIAGSPVPHAFLYTDGAMWDLNDSIPAGSGWVLEKATGINSSGEITGIGLLNGRPLAFILTR